MPDLENDSCLPVPEPADQWLRSREFYYREGIGGISIKDFGHRQRRTESEIKRKRFQRLSAGWKRETAFQSSATRIVTNHYYLQVIAMGWDAVPFILEDMRRGQRHWGTALRMITGENPLQPEDAGRLARQNQVWLDWAAKMGLT